MFTALTTLALTGHNKLSAADMAKLGLLAAIWGASFMLMRLAVPETGPLLTALLRIMLAAVALYILVQIKQIPMHWQRSLKVYTLAGLFGAALPFTLLCYAALYLPVALSALLNATCPLFGALFSMLWLKERLTQGKALGLILGVCGVWLMVGPGSLAREKFTWLALAACMAAPACFAISAIMIKLNTCPGKPDRISPLAMAAGSMIMAGAIMLPLLPLAWPAHMPSAQAIGWIAALALLPSALAQIIFIPLVANIGPTRAMSVAFLIPLFSLLWGLIFLQETIAITSLLGGCTVIAATALMLRT